QEMAGVSRSHESGHLSALWLYCGNALEVVVAQFMELKLDDVADARDIEKADDGLSGYENPNGAILKLLKRALAEFDLLVPMEGGDFYPCIIQRGGESMDAIATSEKDDHAVQIIRGFEKMVKEVHLLVVKDLVD
ncbi:MAG: hypothetical protein QNL77_06005, partial [Akkermansiaceae bacterium]